jgi:hypothetical protein
VSQNHSVTLTRWQENKRYRTRHVGEGVEKLEPGTLVSGMADGAGTVGSSAVSQKAKHRVVIQLSNATLGCTVSPLS